MSINKKMLPEPTPVLDSVPVKERSNTGFVVAWSLVGLFAVAGVLIGFWYTRSIRIAKIDAADARLASAMDDANHWLSNQTLKNGTAIESALLDALGDEHVSERESAQRVLERIRDHRSRLEELQRVVAAKKEAELILSNAYSRIESRDASQAMEILRQYLALEHAREKGKAQVLLDELSAATSEMGVLQRLMQLDEVEFLLTEKLGEVSGYQFTNSKVHKILDDTVLRVLPMAKKRRELVRQMKEKVEKEKARKELNRIRAEEKRLRDEKERLAKIEKSLNALAKNPSDLEKFLHAGDFENGILEFKTRLLTDPHDDNIRFELALLQLFHSVDGLGNSLYRYGLKEEVSSLPFLRLPVPRNPKPQSISYVDFRAIFEDLIQDLDNVDSTLSEIKSADVRVFVRLGVVRFDMDGDGNATQELNGILKKIHQKEFAFLAGNESLPVAFDRGDVAWLRIYCQLLSAVLNLALAFDLEPGFDAGAPEFFENPRVGKRDWNIEKELRIVEPRRINQFRHRLILITELNQEMWKHIRLEKDNDFEWMPNSKQESVLGFTVNDRLVDSWLSAMNEVGKALKGECVLPVKRNGKGINLKVILEDPPEKIDRPYLDNLPESLPDKYFTDGADFNVLTLFTLVNNYQQWID